MYEAREPHSKGHMVCPITVLFMDVSPYSDCELFKGRTHGSFLVWDKRAAQSARGNERPGPVFLGDNELDSNWKRKPKNW